MHFARILHEPRRCLAVARAARRKRDKSASSDHACGPPPKKKERAAGRRECQPLGGGQYRRASATSWSDGKPSSRSRSKWLMGRKRCIPQRHSCSDAVINMARVFAGHAAIGANTRNALVHRPRQQDGPRLGHAACPGRSASSAGTCQWRGRGASSSCSRASRLFRQASRLG